MKEYKGSPALDAGLLAAAQAVEHYEISRDGTLKTWANELGLSDAVRLSKKLSMEKRSQMRPSLRSRKARSIRRRKPRKEFRLILPT